jgi:hypothetical protein
VHSQAVVQIKIKNSALIPSQALMSRPMQTMIRQCRPASRNTTDGQARPGVSREWSMDKPNRSLMTPRCQQPNTESSFVVVVQSVVVIAVPVRFRVLVLRSYLCQPRASVAHTATPPTRNRQASSVHERAQVPRGAGVGGCAEVHVGRA